MLLKASPIPAIPLAHMAPSHVVMPLMHRRLLGGLQGLPGGPRPRGLVGSGPPLGPAASRARPSPHAQPAPPPSAAGSEAPPAPPAWATTILEGLEELRRELRRELRPIKRRLGQGERTLGTLTEATVRVSRPG